MTLIEYIKWLKDHCEQYPEHKSLPVFVECADTGSSWSIEGLGIQDNKVVITLDEFIGPQAPETEFPINR